MPVLTHLALALVPVVSTPCQGAGGNADPATQRDAQADERTLLERRLASRVDEARAAALVRELVKIGPRMGGTASGSRAAARLEREFASLGLPVARHLAPARWCHEETAWSLRARIGDDEPIEIARAWPWGFSPAGSGSDIALSLGPDAQGALLTEGFRGTPRGQSPVAVVLCDGENNLDGTWPLCRPHPRGRRARAPVFGIAAADGQRLRKALDEGRAVRVDWSLETTIAEAQPITVVATLAPRAHAAAEPRLEVAEPAGDAPAQEGLTANDHMLVCAHGDSDSGGPGANDNASGVAIVVEIARAWTAAIREGDIAPPPIEVRFAVWGSEIHSTRAYLESEAGSRCLGVLNFDQAGFGSTGQRIHVEPDDVPANLEFVRTTLAVLEDHAGAKGFPERWASNKSLGGTDSYVFSGAKRFRTGGLPAVTVFTSAWGQPDEQPRTEGMRGESWRERDRVSMDYDLHYHSAGDTPENTTDKEPENMGWCARVGVLTVLRFLGQ